MWPDVKWSYYHPKVDYFLITARPKDFFWLIPQRFAHIWSLPPLCLFFFLSVCPLCLFLIRSLYVLSVPILSHISVPSLSICPICLLSWPSLPCLSTLSVSLLSCLITLCLFSSCPTIPTGYMTMGAVQAAHWAQQSFAAPAAPLAFGVQAPLQVAQVLPGGQPVIWGQANLFHSPGPGQQQWAFVPAGTLFQGLVPLAAMRPRMSTPSAPSSTITSPQHAAESRDAPSSNPLAEVPGSHTQPADTSDPHTVMGGATQPGEKQETEVCSEDLDLSQLSLTPGSSQSTAESRE